MLACGEAVNVNRLAIHSHLRFAIARLSAGRPLALFRGLHDFNALKVEYIDSPIS